MVTKGASGGTLFFTTDDAFRTHAELKGKGVELLVGLVGGVGAARGVGVGVGVGVGIESGRSLSVGTLVLRHVRRSRRGVAIGERISRQPRLERHPERRTEPAHRHVHRRLVAGDIGREPRVERGRVELRVAARLASVRAVDAAPLARRDSVLHLAAA
jgi:hypothetical protein